MPARDAELLYGSGRWIVDLGRRELRANGVLVPIGLRAFEVLAVLVRAAGAFVSKDDLMTCVWPGAIVGDNTLQVHISAIRKALGSDRSILKTVSGRGYCLLGDWTIQRKTSEASPADLSFSRSLPFRSNLPLAVTDLIGRDQAVQQISDLLSTSRTVTLTGSAGIGKTRLAVAVARAMSRGFQGDVLMVELASLSEPGLVASAVATVLGLESGAEKISPISVADAIGRRKILLLLDNCEHVIGAVASLAETVVRQCLHASILTTSRELLRIDDEYTYNVPPLEVPRQDAQSPGDILRHTAVQLFIARMQSTDSGFRVRDADLPIIGAICRRLDGIPLAIEFAAYHAATLGLEQVALRLNNRFSLLTRGRRTALPRHQTLRAALDWSYELLTELDRGTLRRLAIFTSGFTLETAAAIMDDLWPGATTDVARLSRVADGVASLVAKSLVTMDRGAGAARWRLLETTRAYALEKLAECGETEKIARRHAEVFRDLVAQTAFDHKRPSIAEVQAHHAEEIDNVRSALDWAFSRNGDPTIGVVLTAAYVPVWMRLTLAFECRERVERALAYVEPDSKLSARLTTQLHFALGISLVFTTPSSVERSQIALNKALEIAETSDDLDSQLRAVWAIFASHFTGGDYRGAEPAARRFLELAQKRGDQADILIGHRLLGSTLHYKGDQAPARQHLEHVLEHYVAPADHRHKTWFVWDQRVLARSILARVLWMQGFVDQAANHAQQSLNEARSKGNELSLCFALAEAVCPIRIMLGDFSGAEESVKMLLDVAKQHEFNFLGGMGHCLEGKLLIRRGEFAAGSARLRAALDGFRLADHLNFFGDLAEGLARTGRVAEGLATIDAALVRSEHDGVRWCVAEALRLKGELLIRDARAQSAAAAEGCFIGALEVARKQGALFWELRAAMSLARLRVSQDRPREARRLLGPVQSRFTEGFTTADLREAGAMLNALPPEPAGW